MNTHWHSDHVGDNSAPQARGAAIAARTPEAEAVRRQDAVCCAAEYLDQPVAPYTVDMPLADARPSGSGRPTGRSCAHPVTRLVRLPCKRHSSVKNSEQALPPSPVQPLVFHEAAGQNRLVDQTGLLIACTEGNRSSNPPGPQTRRSGTLRGRLKNRHTLHVRGHREQFDAMGGSRQLSVTTPHQLGDAMMDGRLFLATDRLPLALDTSKSIRRHPLSPEAASNKG